MICEPCRPDTAKTLLAAAELLADPTTPYRARRAAHAELIEAAWDLVLRRPAESDWELPG